MTTSLRPAECLHEPVGFKTLSMQPFDTVDGNGWKVMAGGQFLSADGTLTGLWPQGLAWGHGPFNLQLKHNPVGAAYYATKITTKVKPPNNLLKFGFFQGSPATNHAWMLQPYPQIHLQQPVGSALVCTTKRPILDGVPHVLEILLTPVASGVLVNQWCDGKPVCTQTVKWWKGQGKFTGFWINPNSAGGTKSWATTQSMKLDYFYASGA